MVADIVYTLSSLHANFRLSQCSFLVNFRPWFHFEGGVVFIAAVLDQGSFGFCLDCK